MAKEFNIRLFRTRPLKVLAILIGLSILFFYHSTSQLPSVSQFGSKISSKFITQTASRLGQSEVLYRRHIAARQEYLTSHNGYRENYNPWKLTDGYAGWWWYFQPAFNCPWEVERIGAFSKGGLWTCGVSLYETIQSQSWRQRPSPCVLYSITKNATILSFELELIKRTGCDVWIFTPVLPLTITNEPKIRDNPNIHFVKMAIGKTDRISRDGTTFMTLSTIMKDNGHSWIDFLKLDVEGAEYKLLDSWMEHYEVLPFSQLLAGIYLKNESGNEVSFSDFRQWWERAEAIGLRPFWVEQDIPLDNSQMMSLERTEGQVRSSRYSFINSQGKHRLLE